MDSEPALIQAIVFSDSASRDATTGKLTLTGIFERFSSSQVPFLSPSFFATAFVCNVREHIKSVAVKMEIENEQGIALCNSIGEISSESTVARNDILEVPFPMPPTTFRAFGQYKAVVFVDDERLGFRTFNVRLG